MEEQVGRGKEGGDEFVGWKLQEKGEKMGPTTKVVVVIFWLLSIVTVEVT